jgi:hypothetical protein
MKPLLALLLWVAPLLAQAAEEEVLRVQASEPRAYGYQVGDAVQRRVVVRAPAGWTLDEASLPRPGGRGQALSCAMSSSSRLSGPRHALARLPGVPGVGGGAHGGDRAAALRLRQRAQRGCWSRPGR